MTLLILTKDERPFTQEELDQLLGILKVTGEQMEVALVTCAYFFQQAAYYSAKPKTLGAQLLKAEMNQDKAEAFFKVWEKNGEQVNARLQEASSAPHELKGIDWRLNLNVGQQGLAHQKTTNVAFQFTVADNTSEGAKPDQVRVEFTHEQLALFYAQLETIQDQIDAVQK